MLIALAVIVAWSYWQSVLISAVNRNILNQPQSMFFSLNEMRQWILQIKPLRILKITEAALYGCSPSLRDGCSPVNLLHIFRTTFPKNTSGGLLLKKHLRFLLY